VEKSDLRRCLITSKQLVVRTIIFAQLVLVCCLSMSANRRGTQQVLLTCRELLLSSAHLSYFLVVRVSFVSSVPVKSQPLQKDQGQR